MSAATSGRLSSAARSLSDERASAYSPLAMRTRAVFNGFGSSLGIDSSSLTGSFLMPLSPGNSMVTSRAVTWVTRPMIGLPLSLIGRTVSKAWPAAPTASQTASAPRMQCRLIGFPQPLVRVARTCSVSGGVHLGSESDLDATPLA